MTFKYPKAGDLQRQLATNLRANPRPLTKNPWEVRSKLGLEGTYPSESEAKAAAEKLRKQGVAGVTAKPRAELVVPRPAGAPPMYHKPQGKPPGVPNPRTNPPEINEGMARAIWVTTFAQHVEEMAPEERRRSGFDDYLVWRRREFGIPRNTQRFSNLNWSGVAPPTPPWAYAAAEALYEVFEKINDESMNALYATAEAAELAEERAQAAGGPAFDLPDFDSPEMHEFFGHCLAMQAMGHGVSWFDEYATFDLKFPRFDPSTYDDGKLHLPKLKGTR
jgi:hypothetical protein